MKLDDNIFKTYKPKDRNQGRDNIKVENSQDPTTNIDEQLVLCALENTLDPAIKITNVSAGIGPPDIDIGGKIAVEVKGPHVDNASWDKIGDAIKDKMGDLRSAWRRNVNGKGERLRRYDECWIALTVPLPMILLRTQGMDDNWWKSRLLQSRAFFDSIMADCTRGYQLKHPIISRILLLFKTHIPYHVPMYVYNTKVFSLSSCVNVLKFSDQPEQSVVLEKALEWAGLELTSTMVGQSGTKIWYSNEAKSLVR